jgi:hypothetical protein
MITFNAVDNDYLIEEFKGNVNAHDFVLMKKNQIEKTDYLQVKGIMMDIRKANVSITKKKLKQFFAWIVRNKAILENKSIAIITRTMDQLNFGYLFKDQMTEHMIPVKIEQFSSKKEAYKWLNDNR